MPQRGALAAEDTRGRPEGLQNEATGSQRASEESDNGGVGGTRARRRQCCRHPRSRLDSLLTHCLDSEELAMEPHAGTPCYAAPLPDHELRHTSVPRLASPLDARP